MSLNIGADSKPHSKPFAFSSQSAPPLPRAGVPSRLSWYRIYRQLEKFSVNALVRWPNAERAHDFALSAVQFSRFRPRLTLNEEKLNVHAFGLFFPNPIGVAAGIDKQADAIDGWLDQGFGFAEVGTITPKPQEGNPRPRVFRLLANEAIINRFGFNSEGHAAILSKFQARRQQKGIVGINIGANKDSADRIGDYVAGIKAFAQFASYFTVNISSPNTPGLRDLQRDQAFDDLLARVIEARDQTAQQFGRKPMLLKIAPDLTRADLDTIVAKARRRGIDGIIISNTTVSRPGLLKADKDHEAGGLSGPPLFDLSTRVLAEVYIRTESAFPLIGVGGIDTGRAAWKKILAGATLLQLYTALIYKGPALIDDIKSDLINFLDEARCSALKEVVGQEAAARCAEPWPQ